MTHARMSLSLPAWERGLKRYMTLLNLKVINVAPCVGAWIETVLIRYTPRLIAVAPCVGAWIETPKVTDPTGNKAVAPCVGAWIETVMSRSSSFAADSRSLRGSAY